MTLMLQPLKKQTKMFLVFLSESRTLTWNREGNKAALAITHSYSADGTESYVRKYASHKQSIALSSTLLKGSTSLYLSLSLSLCVFWIQ